MRCWNVHTETGDYRRIWAATAREAMYRVWRMTQGRCGSVFSAEVDE